MATRVYSASEARAKLGNMAPSSFHRLVLAGKVRKIVPPNKKQGLYLAEDVEALAEAMGQFLEVYSTHEHFEFGQAQSESDIKATVQIAKQNFGELTHSIENRLAWFKIAPEGDNILKHEGVIVGYVSIQPIKDGALEDHIFVPNGGIRAEDVDAFTPGKPLDVYVTAIATRLDSRRKHNRLYGALLIMGMFDTLQKLGERGIEIQKIWSKSQTVTGIKLSKELGFTELGYIDNEQVGFMLDLESSDHPVIRRYREALKAYRRNAPATNASRVKTVRRINKHKAPDSA